MRITRLNSINATLLIRLYKIFTRQYMDYAQALTARNKTQRQKLEVIQNRRLPYARRAVDSTNISNNPAGNCMFKVNNRNTRTRCEICSKLTIKTPERR